MKYWRHFVTITKHKWYVMMACFKAGLYWQGIMHDLSKYSITEFFTSARYFQGNSSPIDREKVEKGYSLAWQNHKAMNKHHWQYWTDFEQGKLIVLLMPPKYLIEMLCDWVGAGKAYNNSDWTIDTFKTWYKNNKDKMVLHKLTRNYIELVIAHAKSEEDLYANWLSVSRAAGDYILGELDGSGYQPKYKIVEDY